MGLALVTPKPTAQRAEPTEPKSWYADIAKLEAELLELQPTIINAQYRYGKIIHQLHMMFPPHDHWIDYRRQMCKRIGISERTAHNYEQAFLVIEKAGGDALVAAATMEGLNLNKEYVRQVLAVAASQNPELPAGEVVKLAKFAKTHKNEAVDQLPVLRRQFPNVVIQRVGKGEMTDFEVWVDIPASKVRGSGLVMASLTYAQLRSVKGIVKVGERGSFKMVRRFLRLNGGNK